MNGLITATLLHRTALAAVHREAFAGSARWGADAMGLQLATPGAFGWIDERGGMILARVAADEAEILTLAVMPEARRNGIARRLMEAAIAEARRRSARSMVLEVGVLNVPAMALYAALGFAEVGRRSGYYAKGEDALILRKWFNGRLCG